MENTVGRAVHRWLIIPSLAILTVLVGMSNG
jgi:hypothetical protein